MKRILVLATTFPGVNKLKTSNYFLYTYCLCLIKAGFDVHVLTPLKKGLSKSETSQKIKITRFKTILIEKTPFYHHKALYDFKNPIEFFSTVIFFLFYFFEIRKYIQLYKIDLIWAHWIQTGFIAHLAIGRKIPILTTIQGSDIRNFPSFLTYLISKKIKNVVNMYLKDAEIGHWIKKYSFKEIRIPNVYTLKKIKWNKNRNNIMIIGRLENHLYHIKAKGIGDQLFKILKQILIIYPHLKIFIIGHGSKLDYFKQLCSTYSHSINFLGWLDNFDQYVSNASFVIGVSGHGGLTLDTIPYSIPVLISKYDPVANFWKHKKNCLIFNPLDEKNYFNTIKFAIEHPQSLKKYASQANKDLNKYAVPLQEGAKIWKIEFNKFIDFFYKNKK